MKKMIMTLVFAVMATFTIFAVEDTVTVKASVEATQANTRAKNECATKAKKLAVEKYLGRLDSGMPETLVNVLKCKNPRCISCCEQELDQIFRLADPEKREYRCVWCEAKAADI